MEKLRVSDVFMDGRDIQLIIDDANTTLTLCFASPSEYEEFREALKPYDELPNLSPSLDPRGKIVEGVVIDLDAT